MDKEFIEFIKEFIKEMFKILACLLFGMAIFILFNKVYSAYPNQVAMIVELITIAIFIYLCLY